MAWSKSTWTVLNSSFYFSYYSYLIRQLTTHDIDVNQLFTIEALNDECDLVADRNLTTGEIIGLLEVKISKFRKYVNHLSWYLGTDYP